MGIPVRRVFSMLCGGELEGHQDEWARWLVPASALQGARGSSNPSSYRDSLPEQNAGYRDAMEGETRVQDVAETTIISDGRPFLQRPVDGGSFDEEETTQETDEVLVGGSPASHSNTESTDEVTAERISLDGRSDAATSAWGPDDTLKEITERLAAAAAHTRGLRGWLELAEATEAALRENLERERRGVAQESTQAEQHGAVAERLEKEPATGRGDGFWRGLFGG